MTDEQRGLSRRDLIKRGVIAGGLAWTAPVIVQSMTSPAGAQTSPAPPTTTTTNSTPTTAPPVIGPSTVGPPPAILSEPGFTG